MILNQINSPQDVKSLSKEELVQLAAEAQQALLEKNKSPWWP